MWKVWFYCNDELCKILKFESFIQKYDIIFYFLLKFKAEIFDFKLDIYHNH